MERLPRSDNAETIVDALYGSPRPTPTPEWIGSYRIGGRLGSGGMGEVFLAWDEKLKRQVAIKRIRQDAGLSPQQRERFRREAQMAARLSHPNVVQIHAVCEDNDAIVMEYIAGRTLAVRLAADRLETAEVLRLALEIAGGLAAAHEAGLVHRDLKAANVMITEAGHAKIVDFGLARPVVPAPEDQDLTRQGELLGTGHAMSPEQARGQEVDERSDLFSFGSLLHEMLTGRPPFRGTDLFDSMRRVVEAEAVDARLARPDLPAEAARLLRRLLAKNRDDRPASAREVVEILEHIRSAPSSPPDSVEPEESVSDLAAEGAALPELLSPVHGDIRSTVSPVRSPRRVLLVGAVVMLLLAGGATAPVLTIWSAQNLRGLEVRDEDYLDFKEIKQRVDKGDKGLVEPEIALARVQNIVKDNPEFVDGWILGARIARSLFQSKRASEDLNRARDFIEGAKRLAPEDPEPLIEELNLARATQDLERAETILGQLEELLSDTELLWPRALVAEDRGDWDDAAALLVQAVRHAPSWRNRYRLAAAEAQRGRIDEARQQIQLILQQSPDNVLAKEQLAYCELRYGDGDLALAEQLYQELARSVPERAWGNLGTVRKLRGDLQGAEEAYRHALAFHPDHVPALINLAGVEWGLGQERQAKEHYRQALDRLEAIEAEAGLLPSEKLNKAQCLTRLGKPREAVEIAQALSPKITDDPSLLHQSALVYSLAGDRAAALANMQAALDKGISPRWFEDPAFEGLHPQ